MNQFYRMKGIKKEFSVARSPQQNRVAERKNRTLIKAVRTMLADSLLPTTFWAEAVNTACYVQNRVLVTKPHNKTPYELLHGRPPSISFMRPFGCPVTILNTLDPLGKFDGKADEGFLVGYSINCKAFRVFNTRTRKVEENLHITFLENKPNVAGSGPNWLFDIDLLTNFMNYEPNSEDAVADDTGKKTTKEPTNKGERNDNLLVQQKEGYANSTNRISTVSPSVSVVGQSFDNVDDLPTDPFMPNLEDTTDLLNTGIFSGAYDDEGAEADLNNLETTMNVIPIPTTRIYKDHPKDQIIGDINLATQTMRMTEIFEEHAMKVWTLVDLPNGKRAIRTKWVFRNKKDERGIVIRNKARLVAQGYNQEEGIDYDEVFAHIARIEAIRLFLVYASFIGFIMYQMDVKSAFLYGTIKEEVYVCQPPSFEDLQFPDKVYKVEKALYSLYQAPRSWYETLSTYLLENGFRRGTIDKTLFIKKEKCNILVKQKDDGIFISQDKYVADILKKSLMYLTASRPDIMFAVCACARFQVTPKVSHLHAVKRIFRYLKGQPKLGLWYPRDSPFDLETFFDSDYAGASLDRKSTTGAEYVAAANCCGQVLWIQNQMLDYGFNFINTKIHIDNESTICIVKNPVFHSKTKHIEIRHHFIRDSYEKRLIQVIKIHTDHNVVDLLTKAFDVSSDEFGVKTGSCKVNAARQDLVLLGEIISESSVRSNLHFNDEDGVTSLTNSEILENLAFMGYEIEEQVPAIATSHPQKTQTPRQAKIGWDTEIPQSSGPPKKVGDEAVYTGEDYRVERDATTAASLDVEQDSGNILKTQSTKIPSVPLSQGIGTSSSPRCQEAMGGPLHRLGLRGVLALETSKTAQDLVINKLKKKVKRLEKKQRARTSGMKLFKIGTSRRNSLDKENVSKQGRNLKTRQMFEEGDFDDDFDDIDDMVNEAMENVEGDTVNAASAVNTATTGVSAASASVTTVGVSISTDKPRTPPTTTTTAFEDEDLTIAQTLVKTRSEKAKVKGVDFKDVEESARSTIILPTIDPKDKGKGIMQEPEKPPKNPIKAQIQRDAEIAQRLFEEEQAQFKREQRIARERAAEQKAKDAALIKQMEDIQARMDANELLVERLQQEEREQFTIKEKSRMLVEMIAERKRFFAAQRAKQIRNKPPTRAQLRNKMKLYKREQKWINDFVPIDSEVVKDCRKGKVEGSRKKIVARNRTGEKLDDESVKRKKIEEDAVNEALRAYLDIISRDDEAINVESLAIKYLIVDWKTHVLSEDMMYYKIIRGDGSTKSYKIFIEMLDDFDRQDVKDDEIWKAQQDYTLTNWRIFDSCRVHVLLMDTGIAIHMLTEKTYPLTQEMLSRMLSRRLEVDHECEMAYELLRFTRSQLKK
ncbi:putative ribonuclease H-like domain-containing protein [Tanacetum coccineum]|uniref:Ribonuclease H-like domain-containing protein n=1 Tax=Tanacetum coccineum TaxID=301880 RepID=A0ABQ5BCA0_9ASTR